MTGVSAILITDAAKENLTTDAAAEALTVALKESLKLKGLQISTTDAGAGNLTDAAVNNKLKRQPFRAAVHKIKP